MAGEVIPPKPSADANEETKRKAALLAWIDEVAGKVIAAALADVALRFMDNIDDEELAVLDLKGSEFDPIVDEKTGTRLSEAIVEFAEKHQYSEKVLHRLYASALKTKWKKQQTEIPTDPRGEHYGAYMVNRHGVWSRLGVGGRIDGSGLSDDLYVWRRIARTQTDPMALSRDTTSQRNWRHRWRITDETGQFEVEIPNEHLAKKADRAISTLMRHGVHVVETDDARQHLATFLRFRPRARIIRAPRVGWFEARTGTGRWVFVLPRETLGDPGKVNIVLDGPTTGHFGTGRFGFHCSGSSEQWREQVATPLAGNSNAVLAVGVFLAAPLLRWGDEPGGGFHFHGPAKIGKTLFGAVGQSVWGKPFKPGAGADTFGFTWESTVNRLGQRAVLRSDVGLYLDEIGIGDPKAVGATVYKLAGGLDKGRFGQAEQDFNVLFVSTGEPSLAEFLSNAKQGQLVRLVDIPATVQLDSAFETIPADQIAAAGTQFYAATNEFHGSVGYDWLRHLVALTPKQIKAELKHLRAAWLALPQVVEVIDRAHPQVVSVINRFALVAATLHMAIEVGILPWSIADVDTAVIACMARWLKQRGNIDTAGELLRQIRQWRQMIAATIDDRFIRLAIKGRRLVPASEAEQRKMAAAKQFDGFVKDGRILVKPEAWHRLWAGLDADAVKQHLLRTELLIAGPSGEVPSLEKFKSKAPPARFYVLAAAFVAKT